MKYRKKPVVIEAYQTDKELDIETLEGTMHASVGDYIITGVRGEKYPCKPDIFEQTYEPADAPTASPWHRVEEPPKEYGNYLAVVNGEVMEVTYSDMRDDWKWSTCDADGFAWIRSELVTHWMPMPEPPKEVQE